MEKAPGTPLRTIGRMTAPTQDRRGLALVLLALAQFVVVLDASIVNVALPSIGSDLHFSEANLQWVVNAYVLVFGGFLLLGGRMADLLGRRRVFIGGLVLFGFASLVGGLATSEGMLIAARAVQGLGGALLSPAALSIITTTFPEGSERNKALGVWGAVAGAGGAAGVLLGGVLTDSLGWEWVFFVNTPVTLAAAAWARMLLVESRSDTTQRHFDTFGAVTVTASLSLLVYTMVRTDHNGWGSATTIGLFAVSAALLAVFIWWENRSPAPLVPFRIFRLRNLTAANIIGLLTGAALFSMFFFVSLYMQRVLGYSPLKAGLSYLPLAVTIILSAGVASQLTTRFGFKPVMVAGMAFIAIGLLLFAGIDANGSFLSDVLPASIIAAAGLGFAFVPITIASQTGVQPQDAGLASGLINTSQQIGGALGLAVLSTIATSRTSDVLAAAHGAQSAVPNALTEGFQSAFTAGAAFAIAGVVLSLVLLRTRGGPMGEPAADAA
jgi:EmrB/QacA subfamily drug resistance transporter